MTYIKEEWKPVFGFEEYYEVSNLGSVRRKKASRGTRAGKYVHVMPNTYGYHMVALSTPFIKQRKYAVHRLVVEAFIAPIPKGMEVNHINLRITDNRPCNLEIVSHKENMRHAFVNGRIPNGERHYNRKLSFADVKEIRRLSKQGVKYPIIAKRFGVTISNVGFIVRRDTWKCVV